MGFPRWIKQSFGGKKSGLRHLKPDYFSEVLAHTPQDVASYAGADDEEAAGSNFKSTGMQAREQAKFIKEQKDLQNEGILLCQGQVLNKIVSKGNETITSAAISADGNHFAYGSLTVQQGAPLTLVSITDEIGADSVKTKETFVHKNLINAIAFSSQTDADLELVSGDENGDIMLWRVNDNELELLATHKALGPVKSVYHYKQLSADGETSNRYVAVGTGNFHVMVYKVVNVSDDAGAGAGEGKGEEGHGGKTDEDSPPHQTMEFIDVLGDKGIKRDGAVRGVALMPDYRPGYEGGLLVAAGGDDKNLAIYLIEQGAAPQRRNSTPNKRLVEDYDKHWKVPADKVYHVDTEMRVEALSISDDGQKIAYGGLHAVSIICHKTWEVYHDGHGVEGMKSIAGLLLPNWAAQGREGKRTILQDWEETCSLELEGEVSSVCLSGDGQRLLVGSFDKTAKMYDVETGTTILEYKRSKRVSSVALNRTGSLAVVGGFDAEAVRYNTEGGLSKTVVIQEKDKFEIQSVDMSGDGKKCMTCSKGKVTVYDLVAGKEIHTFRRLNKDGKPVVVYAGEITHFGDYCIAGGYDNLVIMYDVESKREVLRIQKNFFIWGISIRHINVPGEKNEIPRPTQELENGEDFLQVAIGSWDKTASVHIISKKKDVLVETQHSSYVHGDRVFSTSLSGDGKLLCVGTRDCKAYVYNLETKAMVTYWERDERVYTVAISHGAEMVAVGDVEKIVAVYSLSTRKETHSWQRGGLIHDVEFSPDDRILVAGGEDNKIVLYNLEENCIHLEIPLQGVCWDLGICFAAGSFGCVSGNQAFVYGDPMHGYGMHDRPDFSMVQEMIETQNMPALQVMTKSHPSIANIFDPVNRRTLLHFAASSNNIQAAKVILEAGSQIVLLEDKNGSNAMVESVIHKRKQMLELIFQSILNGAIVNHPATLKYLYGYYEAKKTSQNDSDDIYKSHKKIPDPDDTGVSNTTLFEKIGETFPDILLKFIEDYPEEKCEKFVLGKMTQAPINRTIYVGLPFRSPRSFWQKYFKKEKEELARQNINAEKEVELAVEAYRLPLQGLLQKFKKEGYKEEGSDFKEFDFKHPTTIFRNSSPLEVVVQAASRMKDYSVFKDGSICSRMIEYKWATIKKYFLLQSFGYLCYLVLCCLLANSIANTRTLKSSSGEIEEKYDSIPELWNDGGYQARIGLVVVWPVMLVSLKYIISEFQQFVREAAESTTKGHFWQNLYVMFIGYFNSYWNFVDLVAFSMQFTACIMFLARATRDLQEVMSIGILFVFLKLLFYGRVWDAFGPLVRMVYRTFQAMIPFLAVMLTIIVGFSMAFRVLVPPTSISDESQEFSTFLKSFLQTTLIMYGEFDGLGDELGDARDNILAVIMFEMNLLVIVIIMLNLLIAIMNDTYTEVNTHANLEYRLEIANIILEIEKGAAFSRSDARLFPAFVHILKPLSQLEDDAKTQWQVNIEQLMDDASTNRESLKGLEELSRETQLEIAAIKLSLKRTTVADFEQLVMSRK